jgi:hypothetical protein
VADDKPILWRPLVEGLAHAEKYSGSRAVAESDLRGLLRDGALPWRGEPRGVCPLPSGDPRVWGGKSEDVDRPIVALAPHWRENRLTRTLYPGRLRSSAQNYRPAPRRYDFARIVIDMGRLRALMPLDASAKANPAEKTIRAAKPKPKLGLAEKWLRAAFPGLEPASIPHDVSAGEADRRIRGLDGGPTIDLSTLKRAMGRKK